MSVVFVTQLELDAALGVDLVNGNLGSVGNGSAVDGSAAGQGAGTADSEGGGSAVTAGGGGGGLTAAGETAQGQHEGQHDAQELFHFAGLLFKIN